MPTWKRFRYSVEGCRGRTSRKQNPLAKLPGAQLIYWGAVKDPGFRPETTVAVMLWKQFLQLSFQCTAFEVLNCKSYFLWILVWHYNLPKKCLMSLFDLWLKLWSILREIVITFVDTARNFFRKKNVLIPQEPCHWLEHDLFTICQV